MGQNLLLDLARIDVGSAGDVHVGSTSGDVDKTLFIHVAEITGAEPVVAERFCVGLGVVIVAGAHGGTPPAHLPRPHRLQCASVGPPGRAAPSPALGPATA